jgi:hypothetical protein
MPFPISTSLAPLTNGSRWTATKVVSNQVTNKLYQRIACQIGGAPA